MKWSIGWIVLLSTICFLLYDSIPAIDAYGDPKDPQQGEGWIWEKVAEIPEETLCQIFIDNEDRPHIFYDSGAIKHSYLDGTEWKSESVPETSEPHLMRFCSGIGPNGTVHVLFREKEGGLFYSRNDADGWKTFDIEEGEINDFSMDIGMDDAAHIAYRVGDMIIYSYYNGTGMESEVVTTGIVLGISIDLDSDGMPWISAFEVDTDHEKKYVSLYQPGNVFWESDSTLIDDLRGSTQLEHDRSDTAYVCYFSKDRTLNHLICDDGAWKIGEKFGYAIDHNFSFSMYGEEVNLIVDNFFRCPDIESTIEIEGFRPYLDCMDFDRNGKIHLASMVYEDGRKYIGHLVFNVELNDPVPVPSYDNRVQIGYPIDLDGSNSTDDTGIAEHRWTVESNGKVTVLVGEKVSFDPERTGLINITYRVAERYGNTAQIDLSVIVEDTEPPVAVIQSDNTVVGQRENLLLEGDGSHDNSGKLEFRWRGNHQSTNNHQFDAYFGKAGIFNVTLEVTDPAGLKDEVFILITVLDREVPKVRKFEDEIPANKGDVIRVNSTGCTDNVGIVSYEWTITSSGKTWKKEGPNLSFECKRSGDYLVTLKITDGAGNSNSTSFMIDCWFTPPYELYVFIVCFSIIVVFLAFTLFMWFRLNKKDFALGTLYSSDEVPALGLLEQKPDPPFVIPTNTRSRSYSWWWGSPFLLWTMVGFTFINIIAMAISLFFWDFSIFFIIGFVSLGFMSILVISIPLYFIWGLFYGRKCLEMNGCTAGAAGISVSYKDYIQLPILALEVPYHFIREIHHISDNEWKTSLKMSNPLRSISNRPYRTAAVKFPPGTRRKDVVTVVLNNPVEIRHLSTTQYIPGEDLYVGKIQKQKVDMLFINVPKDKVLGFTNAVRKARVFSLIAEKGEIKDIIINEYTAKADFVRTPV